MKVNFEWDITDDSRKELYMKFGENAEIEGDKAVISWWLIDDVGDYEDYLEMIDKAIKGEIVQDWIGGNLFCAYLGPQITVFKSVGGDDKVEASLPTTMLREIVSIWLEKIKSCSNF